MSIRLPLYHTLYWRTNDAIEYINLARNLASGQGFVQNFKSDYFTNYPVITSSFHGRTSLISLFLAGIYLLHGNEYTMQIFIFAVNAVNACLVYLLCRKWVKPQWSLAAGFLAALNPNLLVNSRLILTEPLFTMFILLALIAMYYLKEGLWKYAIAGMFTAFSYLTRAEAIILLPLLTFFVKSPNRIVKTIILVASFVLISIPYFYGNYVANGNPLYSVNHRLYIVKDFQEEVNGKGYGNVLPSPITFVHDNFLWILEQEPRVFIGNLNSLVYFDYFGPFLFLLLVLFCKQTWKKFSIFYIYAIFIFLLYTSAWSALFERSRHFTSTFLLLLIPLAYILEIVAKKNMKIAFVILVVTFLPYLFFDMHRIVWARTVDTAPLDRVGPIMRNEEYTWIKNNVKKDDVVSNDNAEMLYLFTDCASIVTPNSLNQKNYSAYIHYYHVKYFVLEIPNRFPFIEKMTKLKASFPYAKVYEVQ